MKIGVMFGNPETTTGGNALKFYSSVRIEVRRRAQLKQGDEVVGNRTVAKVVKNKVAPPFQVAEFDVMYGKGISREGDVVDMGEKMKVLNRAGSWYSFEGNKIGQGREATKKFLRENKKIANKIEREIWKKVKESRD
jgi:recombination protein RecA